MSKQMDAMRSALLFRLKAAQWTHEEWMRSERNPASSSDDRYEERRRHAGALESLGAMWGAIAELIAESPTDLPTDVLTIKKDTKGWAIYAGDRWEEGLGSDEALWLLASFIVANKSPLPYLQNVREHTEWEQRYCGRPLEPWQKQLAPVETEAAAV